MGVSYTAFLGYGYILNEDEIDVQKYYDDLYDSHYMTHLDEFGGSYFYGVKLKICDLEYNVEEVSKITREDLTISKEAKEDIIKSFQKDFPQLKNKRPYFRIAPHIW